jgi:hypothetical protein
VTTRAQCSAEKLTLQEFIQKLLEPWLSGIEAPPPQLVETITKIRELLPNDPSVNDNGRVDLPESRFQSDHDLEFELYLKRKLRGDKLACAFISKLWTLFKRDQKKERKLKTKQVTCHAERRAEHRQRVEALRKNSEDRRLELQLARALTETNFPYVEVPNVSPTPPPAPPPRSEFARDIQRMFTRKGFVREQHEIRESIREKRQAPPQKVVV